MSFKIPGKWRMRCNLRGQLDKASLCCERMWVRPIQKAESWTIAGVDNAVEQRMKGRHLLESMSS